MGYISASLRQRPMLGCSPRSSDPSIHAAPLGVRLLGDAMCAAGLGDLRRSFRRLVQDPISAPRLTVTSSMGPPLLTADQDSKPSP
jgi:hypothetical protein